MNIQSEKVFYEKQVNDELAWIDAEGILWGEDLYDSTIILYPKKITEIPGYAKMKSSLINAVVVFFDFSKEKYIKNTIVRYDWEERKLFITEGNFNALWKFLRNSVNLGIRLQKENGSELSVSRPEDIVDLSLIQKKGAEAVIKNGQLTYVARQIPESELKLQGRKQSLLDNAKYRFYYSAAGGAYHDKDCECVKSIAPESFMASEDEPEGYKPCKLCRRRLYLRIACSPYVKQIPAVDRLLHSGGIMDFNLEKYAMDYGLKFSTDADGVLTVKGDEDIWLIKGFNQNYLTLWHNNYARISAEERYITDGFHNQGLDGKKLYTMLEYINNYSFEKHLAAECAAVEILEAEKKASEAMQPVATAISDKPVAVTTDRKQGTIKRFIARIKSFFAGAKKEDGMGNYITNAKYREIILEIIRFIKADTPKEELIQYLNDLISKNK